MRYPDHLHHCLRRCQDADSSDERGRGRVPCETVRSSIVAHNGPCRTGYVSNVPIVCGAWKGVLWQIMQQLRTLRGARPNVDSIGSLAIVLSSNLFSTRWSRLRPRTRQFSSRGRPAQEKSSSRMPFTTPVSASDTHL